MGAFAQAPMRSRRPADRMHPTPPIGPTHRPKDSNQRVRLTESQTRRETPHPSSLAYVLGRYDRLLHGPHQACRRVSPGRRGAGSSDRSPLVWTKAAPQVVLRVCRHELGKHERSGNQRGFVPF